MKPPLGMLVVSALIGIALGAPTGFAQSASFPVKVYEQGTGRSLPRTEIRIGQSNQYTDADGRSAIANGPADTLIMFSKDGFETLTTTRGALSTNPEVYLLPGAPDDDEIIIRGSRRSEASKKTITIQETSRIAPGGDPAQITKILPGVQTQAFQPEVIIRGSGPNDSRYFIDDLRVGSLFHPVGNISVVPPLMLDQVEFSSGGFGSQYGEATGGVITLRSTTTIPERPRQEYRFSVPFYVSGYYETPLSADASLIVAARQSLTEFIIPKVIEASAADSGVTAVPTFADAHLRYLTKDDDGHTKLTFITSNDGVVAAAPIEEFADQSGTTDLEFRNRFTVLGLERRQNLGDGATLTTTPQIYNSHARFLVGSVDGVINVTSVSVPTEYRQRLDRKQYFYVGLEPGYATASVAITAPRPDSNDPFYDIEEAPLYRADRTFINHSLAAWVSYDWRWQNLTLTPGVRSFRNAQVAGIGTDPRLSWRYQLGANDSDLNLKGAIGQYSQSPEPVESSEEFGNPDLGYEASRHLVLGIEGRISDRWQFDIQVFDKQTEHLVRSHPTKGYDDAGTLKVQGFELFLRRFLTAKTFGWLAYTYAEAKERSQPEDKFHTSPYDQTHILHLAWAYKFNASWELATRIQYASGKPYTPVTGAAYNANLDKFQPSYDTANPYSAKFPANDSTDIYATYESYFDQWRLSQRFGVQFISLKQATDSVVYSYDYQESKPQGNGLPAIPFYEIGAQF